MRCGRQYKYKIERGTRIWKRKILVPHGESTDITSADIDWYFSDDDIFEQDGGLFVVKLRQTGEYAGFSVGEWSVVRL